MNRSEMFLALFTMLVSAPIEVLKKVFEFTETLTKTVKSSVSAALNLTNWELKSPRDSKGEKVLEYQHVAQARLAKQGMRLPHFREMMAPIIEWYKNKTTSVKELVDDMLDSFGEWSDEAYKTDWKKNVLHVYENVSGLILTPNCHDSSKMEFDRELEFSISGLKRGRNKLRDIVKLHPKIVEHFYGMRFEDLPKNIQDNAGIWLADDNKVMPAGRGGFGNGFYVGIGGNDWASRGYSS